MLFYDMEGSDVQTGTADSFGQDVEHLHVVEAFLPGGKHDRVRA